MRLVEFTEGAFELQWQWLPYWMAVHPTLRQDVETELHDIVILNPITAPEAKLDALSDAAARILKRRFGDIPGATEVIDAIRGC